MEEKTFKNWKENPITKEHFQNNSKYEMKNGN